jgi:glucose/mannose transport system permease protein
MSKAGGVDTTGPAASERGRVLAADAPADAVVDAHTVARTETIAEHRAAVNGPSGPRPRRILSRRNIFLYGTLIVVALYYILPLYVMVVTSLKGMPEIRLGNIFSPPMEITFEPWVKAWSEACTGLNCEGLSRGFWNSVWITVPSVVLSIAVASVNGYALANWRFKGANVFFTILIFGAFIPYQVMLYPIVILLREMGLYGKLPGLVLVHTIFGMPILTLLFRNYFSSIPEELFKAARIDGAGFWGIFFQVMLPMSLPIFVVAMILQITGIWNDFLFGVIYTKPDTYPMTVQLNNIVNSVQGVKEYNVNMAATILTGMVPLIVYFFSGKLFVRGIAAGAVKG